MLKEIRIDRDEGIKAVNWYTELSENFNGLQRDLEESQKQALTFNTERDEYRSKTMELRKQLLNIGAKSSDDKDIKPIGLKRDYRDKSTKLPDPPTFTDGVNPT